MNRIITINAHGLIRQVHIHWGEPVLASISNSCREKIDNSLNFLKGDVLHTVASLSEQYEYVLLLCTVRYYYTVLLYDDKRFSVFIFCGIVLFI